VSDISQGSVTLSGVSAQLLLPLDMPRLSVSAASICRLPDRHHQRHHPPGARCLTHQR